MDHNVYFYIHITYACVSDPVFTSAYNRLHKVFVFRYFKIKYLQKISARISLTPLPALVPEPDLGPVRGALVVGPVADDVGAARAVLDVSVGRLVRLAAQGRGRGLGGQDVEVVPHFVLGLCKARHVYGDIEFVIL